LITCDQECISSIADAEDSRRHHASRHRQGNAVNHTSKIAVIDDDASMREALSALMRSMGWQVQCHASASDFLAELGYDATDCIVTDVQMPGMSGVELLEWLRGRQLATPVVVITSYPTARARRACAGSRAGGLPRQALRW
jgi:DNA-binding NtrC family response regulator